MTKHRQQGFTIVELLIATTVFSVVLLLCSAGVIYVGRLYYKGVTSQAVQEVTRSAIDQIKTDFELSGGTFTSLIPNGANQGFCIGSHLYSYQTYDDNPTNWIDFDGVGHALVVRDEPGCENGSATPDDVAGVEDPDWREFLGPGMRLFRLDVTGSNDDGTPIAITVISGPDGVFDGTTGLCNNGSDSQFCASSSLETYATRRL